MVVIIMNLNSFKSAKCVMVLVLLIQTVSSQQSVTRSWVLLILTAKCNMVLSIINLNSFKSAKCDMVLVLLI